MTLLGPPTLLAPVGRAEPDDAQGWIEQGGLLALQAALALDPASLRQRLAGVERRDGAGKLNPRAGQPVHLTLGEGGSPARFLLDEIPAWVIGGGLLLALACEQPILTLHLPPDAARARHLLQEIVQGMERIHLVGADGWVRGAHLFLKTEPAPKEALDPVTAHLLTSVIAHGRDPGTTLLTLTHHSPVPYEVSLGPSVTTLLASLGFPTPPDSLILGEQRLDATHWHLPLTFAHFGRALGSGRLTLPHPSHP